MTPAHIYETLFAVMVFYMQQTDIYLYIWWLSQQMGHVDAEMITRNYGKWIPDSSKKNGYKPSGNYADFEQIDTQTTRKKEA